MFSKVQNTEAEEEKLLSNPSTQDILNLVSDIVENVASGPPEKRDLDNNDTTIIHCNKEFSKVSKPEKLFVEISDNNRDLEDSLNISNVLSFSRQSSSYQQFLETRFPLFQEMVSWNISLNTLTEKIISKAQTSSRRRHQVMELRKRETQDCLFNLNNDSKHKGVDFANGSSNENQKLNLLCVFTNDTDYETVSSDFNNMYHDEDIRLILPKTKNIVVAHNVLTISDENNQHITIHFRRPLKAKFDYKYSNLSSGKKFRFSSSMNINSMVKNSVQNSRMKKMDAPYEKIKEANPVTESFNRRNSTAVQKPSKEIPEKKATDDSFLLLREPILLNCIEQNKTKQMLMYKAHSVKSVVKNENKINFSKILEELLAKSLHYEAEPIYLLFEPLKEITRLKRKEKIRDFKLEKHRKRKLNLIGSPIYKKIVRYKNTQMLRGVQHERQTFKRMMSKNEHTMQGENIMSSGSVITTQSCLDLPKNFSPSFMMKCFDMNKSIIQKTESNEIFSESGVTTHSCSGLMKNFSSPVSRKRYEFDIDELFGGNKSRFSRRMSTTELKQVNAIKLVSSVFRHFFHFYSLYDGSLRSGTAITRASSNYWLKVAGVAKDSCTLKLAGELFTTLAGKKVVLNIFDYVKFLIAFARTRNIFIRELVKQMMICDDLSNYVHSEENCKRGPSLKNERIKELTEFCYEESSSQISKSWPNIWPPKANSNFGKRGCLSDEIF